MHTHKQIVQNGNPERGMALARARLGSLELLYPQPFENSGNAPKSKSLEVVIHCSRTGPLAQLRVPDERLLAGVLEPFFKGRHDQALSPRQLQDRLELAVAAGGKLSLSAERVATTADVARAYLKNLPPEAAPALQEKSRDGLLSRVWNRWALQSAHLISAKCTIVAGSIFSAAAPWLLPGLDMKSWTAAGLLYAVAFTAYWVPYFSLLVRQDRARCTDKDGIFDHERYRAERKKDIPNVVLGEVLSLPLRIGTLKLFAGLLPRELFIVANFGSWAISNAVYVVMISPLRNRWGPACAAATRRLFGQEKQQ